MAEPWQWDVSDPDLRDWRATVERQIKAKRSDVAVNRLEMKARQKIKAVTGISTEQLDRLKAEAELEFVLSRARLDLLIAELAGLPVPPEPDGEASDA